MEFALNWRRTAIANLQARAPEGSLPFPGGFPHEVAPFARGRHAFRFGHAACAAQQTLTGQDAFTDYTKEHPGVRRKLTVADLPQPYATQSANNAAAIFPARTGCGRRLRLVSRWSSLPPAWRTRA